jgi:hypothetical protein
MIDLNRFTAPLGALNGAGLVLDTGSKTFDAIRFPGGRWKVAAVAPDNALEAYLAVEAMNAEVQGHNQPQTASENSSAILD